MLNISDDQKKLLLKYLPDTRKYIDSGEIDPILDVLDANYRDRV